MKLGDLRNGLELWRKEWAALARAKRQSIFRNQREFIVLPGEPPEFEPLREIRRVMKAAGLENATESRLQGMGFILASLGTPEHSIYLPAYMARVGEEGTVPSARQDPTWNPPKFYILHPETVGEPAIGKADVLAAMSAIEKDGIPDGFGEPKVWFVRHPGTGSILPAKATWGRATGQRASDFDAHQARDALRGLGFQVLGNDEGAADIAESPDSLETLPPRFEGAERQVTRNIRERNPIARRESEEYYRARDEGQLRCQGCNIDFSVTYGPRGAGFMHFHHLAPLSEAIGRRAVSGAADLVPLCPNCHAMVHRGDDILSIEQLRDLLTLHAK